MSEKLYLNEEIITLLVDHPKGTEMRSIALDITDCGFREGIMQLIPEIVEDHVSGEEMNKLIQDFRIQVKKTTGINLDQGDNDLFQEIILPLITRLLRRSY